MNYADAAFVIYGKWGYRICAFGMVAKVREATFLVPAQAQIKIFVRVSVLPHRTSLPAKSLSTTCLKTPPANWYSRSSPWSSVFWCVHCKCPVHSFSDPQMPSSSPFSDTLANCTYHLTPSSRAVSLTESFRSGLSSQSSL